MTYTIKTRLILQIQKIGVIMRTMQHGILINNKMKVRQNMHAQFIENVLSDGSITHDVYVTGNFDFVNRIANYLAIYNPEYDIVKNTVLFEASDKIESEKIMDAVKTEAQKIVNNWGTY